MNSPSNALREAAVQAHVVAAADVPESRRLYWSVKRELWDNRWIYLAPLGVAGLFLLGFLVTTAHLPARVRGVSGLETAQQQAITVPYDMAAGLMMLTILIGGIFYCLDALYGERRDRSILFWKSLPVSDVTTVLSKLAIPMIVFPLLAFAIAIAMQWFMLLVSCVVLLASGVSPAPLWAQLSFGHRSLLLLYHLVTGHSLWPAPIFGWLLLVSAWARRAPVLWATLPLLAIGFVEKVAFNSSYFLHLVLSRFTGAGSADAMVMPGTMPTNPMTHITPLQFLSSPGLWLGLLVTAAFLAIAVRVRRSSGPI